MARSGNARRPVGTITRGTTNPNRLRRCDRWLAGPQALRLTRSTTPPVVVDLGYGSSPVTAVELFDRLRRVRPDVRVVGIEIDPERVAAARALERPNLTFRVGGFEVPLDGAERPTIVRAFNVLRQYDEAQVPATWDLVRSRLAPGGLFVDGTCDEVGRRATWVAIEECGPVSLTVSLRLRGLDRPSDAAERLPKALIHRNVPGEPVHAFLTDLDRAWERTAPLATYGARQRFVAAVAALLEPRPGMPTGWPLESGPARWRLGEVTVAWAAVSPRSQ